MQCLHSGFHARPSIDKLDKRIYLHCLSVCLNLAHVRLRRNVQSEINAVSESASNAVKLELEFVPHRHTQRFQRVFNECAFSLLRIGIGLPVINAAHNIRHRQSACKSGINHVIKAGQVKRIIRLLKRHPHKFPRIGRLTTQRVYRNHVINHAVIASGALERLLKLILGASEIVGGSGHDAHHASRNRPIGEEATLVIRYHVIDVRPLADGLRRADATRRVKRVSGIAERDSLIPGKSTGLQTSVNGHSDAMRPSRMTAIPLSTILWEESITGDIVRRHLAARLNISALIRPHQNIKMRLGENTIGDEFQEFKARELVIRRVQCFKRRRCRVDTLALSVHRIRDDSCETSRNGVRIWENLRVSVIRWNHLRSTAANPSPPFSQCWGRWAREETSDFISEFRQCYRLSIGLLITVPIILGKPPQSLRGRIPVNQPPAKKKDQSFTGILYNTSTSQLVNLTGVYTLNSVASARSGEPTLFAAL